MVVSGHEVVEALQRAGFRVDRSSHGSTSYGSTRMTHGDSVVFVPSVLALDEAALAMVLLDARLTLARLVELLEPPTVRQRHVESHVRVRHPS